MYKISVYGCAIFKKRDTMFKKQNANELKPSSLKAFLKNGQMPEFSNTAYILFMVNENGYAYIILLVSSWILIFFQDWHHPLIFCNSVFCLKSSHDSNIKNLLPMCTIQWKSDHHNPTLSCKRCM